MENRWLVWQKGAHDLLGVSLTMLTTQHSDLVWLAKSKTPLAIYLVPTRHKGETWYQMMVELQGVGQKATLLNRQGMPRVWKNLTAATRFVAKTLVHVEAVTVMIKRAL